MFQVGVKSWC